MVIGLDPPPAGYFPPGRGRPVLFVIPPPVAGVDFSATLPAGSAWRILGGSAQLVTSATVATRQVYLRLLQGTTEIWRGPSPNTQVASLTYVYQLMPGIVVPTLVGTFPVVPWPVDCYADPRFSFASATTSIQATDQWSAITLLLEQLKPAPPE